MGFDISLLFSPKCQVLLLIPFLITLVVCFPSLQDANKTILEAQVSSEVDPNSDLYVIKAVVYEVGVVTNSSDEADSSSEEEIDLVIYDPKKALKNRNLDGHQPKNFNVSVLNVFQNASDLKTYITNLGKAKINNTNLNQ